MVIARRLGFAIDRRADELGWNPIDVDGAIEEDDLTEQRIGPGGGEVDDEGEDLHLGTAEGAEQRVDLVDAANKQGPTEPSASGDLVFLIALGSLGSGVAKRIAEIGENA